MKKKIDRLEIIQRTFIFVFFSSIFFHLTSPIFETDFWWHLASGRWMWENKSLLHDDPFAISYQFAESPLRKEFILKQYWLSQLLFYGTYLLVGFKGLILLRATVITLMFFTLYRLIRGEGAGHILSVPLIFLSAIVIMDEFPFYGVRPQLWTSLFAVVVVYFLEALRRDKKWAYISLPSLMLIWSNLHAGFILGDLIIVVYIIGTLISRSCAKKFYIVAGLSILISGLNPNGFTASFIVLLTFFDIQTLQYWQSIVEGQSIFKHASLIGITKRLPYFSIMVLLSLCSFVLNIRRIRDFRLELVLLYILVLIMGIKSIRYIIFFVSIASFIAAINVKEFTESVSFSRFLPSRLNLSRTVTAILTTVIVASFTLNFAIAGYKRTALLSEKPYDTDYENAIHFVKTNRLRGNLFNDYNQGGYLIWWLTPDIKVFIDGRSLYYTAFNIYRAVIDAPFTPISRYDGTPIYARMLDLYNINLILISGCDRLTGTIIQLSLALLKDTKWALVYADSNALVFMKDNTQNSGFIKNHELPDTAAYKNILSMAFTAARSDHGHITANWKLSAAIGYEGTGDKQKAFYWVNEYLKSVPREQSALMLKKRIEEELRISD